MLRVYVVCIAALLATAGLQAVAQEAEVSTSEAAAVDPDFIRYPGITVTDRAYFLERWKQMLAEAKRGLAEAQEAESRGLNTQAVIDRYIEDIDEARSQIKRLSSERANRLITTARNGKVKDIELLREDASVLMGINRQCQLLDCESAEQRQREVFDAVIAFTRKFADTCEDQVFDPLLPLGLGRQAALIGQEVELEHCTYRLYEGTISTGAQLTRWRHCGIGTGIWRMRAEGLDVGEGEADMMLTGDVAFQTRWTQIGSVKADVTQSGALKFVRKEIADAQGQITSVEYTLAQDITTIEGKMFMMGRALPVSGVPSRAEVKVEIINGNKPCRLNKDVWSYGR